MKKKISFLLALLLTTALASAQVKMYEWPEQKGPQRSTDYEVSVKSVTDKEWVSVPVLQCEVDMRSRSKASFAEFDMQGEVRVRVRRCLPADMKNVAVRPLSRKIKIARTDANTIEFTLRKSEYLSVEFDGDTRHNLHLFANPMLTERHSPDEPQSINWTGQSSHDVFVKDARLIYFGPGVHQPKDLPSGDIRIPSNCTVYLAPGAVVQARLIVDHAENVRIIGRGILDHPLRGVEITFSKNVLVDGITVLNPQHYTIFGGQSDGITIRNLKAFSCRGWSDGIDLMCCRNVSVNHVFLRNSDDNIALYNHRWWYWGGSSSFDISDAVLWADVAHPVNIGTHGDDRSEAGETLKNVDIHDCDILYARTNAALNVACGDKNHIKDVKFRDIRVENVDTTALVGLRVVYGAKYNRAPGNEVTGVLIDGIRFTGDATMLKPSFVENYDAGHVVSNVRIDNVYLNGNKTDVKGFLLNRKKSIK